MICMRVMHASDKCMLMRRSAREEEEEEEDGTGRDGRTGCIQNENPHTEEWWEKP